MSWSPDRSVQAIASVYKGWDRAGSIVWNVVRYAIRLLPSRNVVAKAAGALDRLLPEWEPCLRLAGEEIRGAQGGEGIDEQPVIAEVAGDLDCLFSKLPCCGEVNELSGARSGVQCRAEQCGVGAGVGPLEHRNEQPEGLLLPGAGSPVALERDAQAQDQRGPIRAAGRMPGGAPQVGLIGVQAGQPAALVRPAQMSSRRVGDRQEMRAVRRGDRGGLAAGLGQPLSGEQADGLQQPVAEGREGRLGDDEALVHQRTDPCHAVA